MPAADTRTVFTDVDGRQIFSAPATAIVSTTNANDVIATTRDLDTSEGRLTSDEVIDLLENTPSKKRGSRKLPSIMRFPSVVGSVEIPHSMQFKVFWRWEAKSIVDARKKKAELDAKIQNYTEVQRLLNDAQFSRDNVEKEGFDNITSNRKGFKNNIGPLVDAGTGSKLDRLMRTDPEAARSIIEETVRSTQSQVDELNKVIGNGGRTNLSQNDRAQFSATTSLAAVESAALGLAGIAAATSAATGVAVVVGVANGTPPVDVYQGANDIGRAVASFLGGALITVPEFDQMVSIYLPICTKINNEDTFSYEEDSFKILAGIAGLANIDSGQAALDNATQSVAALLAGFADAVGVGAEKQLAQGSLLNPRLEKTFKQKDFRTFTFSWEMYPTTADESQALHDIIETFRYHAHPAISNETFGGGESKAEIMMRVPAEFEIRFLSTVPKASFSDLTAVGLIENPYIPKIARCACTSITVDYTPQNVFSTFQNNAPIGVIFSISFSEMSPLHRGAVEQGF